MKEFVLKGTLPAQGRYIYEGIRTKGKQLKALGGGIRVAQNVPNKAFPDPDSKELAKEGAIDLR